MTTPQAFGRDMSCTDAIRTTRLVSGTRLVAEACYRRLITPRGSLIGGEAEASYGLDLTSLVGTTDVDALAASLPGRIAIELQKDDRVGDVSTNVVVTKNGPAATFGVTIRVTTTEAESFTLTLAVTEVSVALLGISEGV